MKKILIVLFLMVACLYSAVLPVNKVIGTTYEDVSADIASLGLIEAENFTIYNDSGSKLEIIVDTTGAADINSTFNNKGLDVNSESLEEFEFSGNTKYYVRAKSGNSALIKINTTGFLSIHDADVHNIPFNEFFHNHTGVDALLAVAVTAGDTNITVDDATGFVVGDTVQIEDGVIETTFPTITNIASTVFTLDRPLDFSFDINDTVEVVDEGMDVNASLASPVSFKLIPDGTQLWHVISVTISMVHSSAADDSKFGDIAALTNGIVFRGYNGTANRYRTLTNWKTNGDIKLDFGEVTYSDKAGGGAHGTQGIVSIKFRAGAVPSIDGNKGDFLEILIQDDITGLSSIKIKSQGHIIRF